MKFAAVLITGLLAVTVNALAPRELAPHNFALREDYKGRLSGGYDHKLLIESTLVQFTTNVTRSDGTIVPAINQCPGWYNACINAEPDYAAADGGSTAQGDEWCEDHCTFTCPHCDTVSVPETGVLSSRTSKWEGHGRSSLEERSTCTDVCDLISVGSRTASVRIKSLVAAAGAALAKAACYATCGIFDD